jgi:uncharacterized protein RhaS with RHS repeats
MIWELAWRIRLPGGKALNQNYFRDYDPQTGRYVESDPIGLKAGINTYSYVRDNPTMYRDLFGLQASTGDNAVDRLIEIYKKAKDACLKDGEDCQKYSTRIYKMCVTSGIFLNGPACKLVSDHFAEACILDPQGVACKRPLACLISSGTPGG